MANETDAPSSVEAVRLRVALLDSTGATPVDAKGMYVTDSLVHFSWDPVIHTGFELEGQKGDGTLCTTWKTDDSIKRYNCELEICSPDPELTQILMGGTVLLTGGNTSGYAPPALGTPGTPNGISIEIWSLAISGGAAASPSPYFWWIFPKAKLVPAARDLGALIMPMKFTGFLQENLNWGNGPNNDWLKASNRAWEVDRTATIPASATGYQAIPAQI